VGFTGQTRKIPEVSKPLGFEEKALEESEVLEVETSRTFTPQIEVGRNNFYGPAHKAV
jgi:hypothetical protein